jgi:hypothetical protein
MTTAFYLLLLIGHLGAFDVLYFHGHRCRLAERPECRREVLWHTLRHAVYAGQFVAVANLRFHGAALWLLVALYAADVFVAWADVWAETTSRKPQGGLPRGEYLMHVVLSVLVGAYLCCVAGAVWPDRLLPAAIVVEPPAVPGLLRGLMTAMGAVAALTFVYDLVRWLRPGARTQQKAIVVEALIEAPLEEVWQRTQDPELHLLWDIRFDSIRYTRETDARGFALMDYRTSLGFGVEVAGTGRYLQNSPLRHSTFEFGSRDWKSLITRGRGIWQYERRPGGTFFRTVFDYQVRYGVIGRTLDLVFRPVMRLATEWGFETLRLWCAGEGGAPARRARRPFLSFFLKRALGVAPASGAARSWTGAVACR